MVRLILLMLLMLGLPLPAAAQPDDVAAAARSVVRVATGTTDGEQTDVVSYGTGFAVGANRIVTNAHVVAPALEDPDNVRIGVVPSEGSPPTPARLIAVDPARDLALIELTEGSLPRATLYTGTLRPGASVSALGYPGGVDMATARTVEELLQPRPASRSMGNFSDVRQSEVGPALVHTASIQQGNSGGPLVDVCGRVVGVNVAITGNDVGSSFGFAVPVASLVDFLRGADQPFRAVSAPCVSAEALARAEDEREEQEREAREQDEQERLRAADKRRELALAALQETRENRLYVSILLLVLSVVGFGAAGLLAARNRYQPAAIAGGLGGLLMIASAVIFLTRPSLTAAAVADEIESAQIAEASRFVGDNLCRLDETRSRVTISETREVRFAWGEEGCVNESTQYAREGDVWRRVLVPNDEQTVTVSEFDPGAGEYVVSRYLLSAREMKEARTLRRRIEQKACTSDEEARQIMADRQRDLIRALPAQANERLVYDCEPAAE